MTARVEEGFWFLRLTFDSVLDNHVPPEGRDIIRKTLRDAGVTFSWYEVAWAQRTSIHTLNPLSSLNITQPILLFHFPSYPRQNQKQPSFLTCNYLDAFIRDELSKGRYDPAISKICFEILLELFNRALKTDLGAPSGEKLKIEDIC